jgi:hypothetical protein
MQAERIAHGPAARGTRFFRFESLCVRHNSRLPDLPDPQPRLVAWLGSGFGLLCGRMGSKAL